MTFNTGNLGSISGVTACAVAPRAHVGTPRLTHSATPFKAFFDAYIHAALWSSCDIAFSVDSFDAQGKGAIDLAPGTWETMKNDCFAFMLAHGSRFEGHEDAAGGDLWFTRNGHGVGFWSETHTYGEESAAILTRAAHRLGSYDLLMGEDGLIYGTGGAI